MDNDVRFVKTTSSKLDSGEVQDILQGDYPDTVIYTHDDNGDNQLYIGEEQLTDKFNVGDTPDNTPIRKLGGLSLLSDVSTIGDLKQKSISEIILDMVRPSVVVPSVSKYASVSIAYSGLKLIEVGTNLPTITSISDATNIEKGMWADTDKTPYAGEPTDSIAFSISSPGNWGEPAEEGVYTIFASVSFSGGGIPKDNFGKPYPDKQYHGGTKTDSITVTAVYPIYINGYYTREGSDNKGITDMRKYLINYNSDKNIEITIPAETYFERLKIYVPYEFSKLQLFKYDPTRSDITKQNPNDWTIEYNPKGIDMKFVDDEIQDYPGYGMYIRDPEKDASYNTTETLYKITLKK